MIRKTQIVRSAIKFQHGIFVADIPVHLSIRDASGISAVIEFENGLVQIYENAGNVLTNEPSYPDQLLNAKKYDNILPATTEGLLTGIPGGSDSKDRFARAYIYLRSLNQPSTHFEALYQADRVINTLIRPYLGYRGGGSNSCSIWYVIKDLDEKVVYEKNLLFYQDFSTISVSDISNGFHKVDLKAIDFNVIPKEYADFVVKPTDPKKILKIIKASEIPGF